MRDKMKFLFMLILFCGFLVVEHQAAEELDLPDINITPDESKTDQHIDIDANEGFSRTSAEDDGTPLETKPDGTPLESKTDVNNDALEQFRTSLNEEADLEQDKWPEDVDLLQDTSPLDWTTLDRGLQDLHNLISQIDDISPSQNESNASQDDDTEGGEEEPSKPKYPCIPRHANTSNDISSNVTVVAQARIVNATELLELVTSKADLSMPDNSTNTTEGHCVFVMFYAPWCKFSTASAPHFNAIGRAFADIDVIAVDAFQFRSINARYGTVSVPNFLFFYNNKPVLRYNYSERNFNSFVEFLQNHTGLVANSSVNVTDIDYDGPVPSILSEEPDYALWFSGIFLLGWCLWILKVQYGTVIATRIEGAMNYMRHIWRTGEFYEQVGMLDHEHVD